MLKWPDARTVADAVRHWAAELASARPEVLRIGYFGSYARDDWGVGSDLDIVIVLDHSSRPYAERGPEFDATSLPVPVDLMVYTEDEFAKLARGQTRLAATLQHEVVWVYPSA